MLLEKDRRPGGEGSNWIGMYVLDGHQPVPCYDPLLWGAFFENIDVRRVKQEFVRCMGLKVWVSTMFLGLDHDHTTWPMVPRPDPLVFETMVFGPCEWNRWDWRERTWRDADLRHIEIVESLRFSGWWNEAFDEWFKEVLVRWLKKFAFTTKS